jgi:hypothetical protein
MRRRSYLWPAFTFRPLGMPIPPNWFGLAAFGLLGAFLSAGFWLVGAGLEVAYLALLSRSARFRAGVDAREGAARGEEVRLRQYDALLARLPPADRERQARIEERCAEIAEALGPDAAAAQEDGLAQLAWLHLRLLSARASLRAVVAEARTEAPALREQEEVARSRLAGRDLPAELRRSFEQQVAVIDARQAAHAEAATRLERAESELERIAQQVALARDQARLAQGEGEIARATDALAASLGEASRWAEAERELLGLDDPLAAPPPARILDRQRARRAAAAQTGAKR